MQDCTLLATWGVHSHPQSFTHFKSLFNIRKIGGGRIQTGDSIIFQLLFITLQVGITMPSDVVWAGHSRCPAVNDILLNLSYLWCIHWGLFLPVLFFLYVLPPKFLTLSPAFWCPTASSPPFYETAAPQCRLKINDPFEIVLRFWQNLCACVNSAVLFPLQVFLTPGHQPAGLRRLCSDGDRVEYLPRGRAAPRLFHHSAQTGLDNHGEGQILMLRTFFCFFLIWD